MRIIDAIDKDYFRETGILRLPYHFPICQSCGRERSQEERQFIFMFGKCSTCKAREEAGKDEN